jgi:hypothetical protein
MAGRSTSKLRERSLTRSAPSEQGRKGVQQGPTVRIAVGVDAMYLIRFQFASCPRGDGYCTRQRPNVLDHLPTRGHFACSQHLENISLTICLGLERDDSSLMLKRDLLSRRRVPAAAGARLVLLCPLRRSEIAYVEESLDGAQSCGRDE